MVDVVPSLEKRFRTIELFDVEQSNGSNSNRDIQEEQSIVSLIVRSVADPLDRMMLAEPMFDRFRCQETDKADCYSRNSH